MVLSYRVLKTTVFTVFAAFRALRPKERRYLRSFCNAATCLFLDRNL